MDRLDRGEVSAEEYLDLLDAAGMYLDLWAESTAHLTLPDDLEEAPRLLQSLREGLAILSECVQELANPELVDRTAVLTRAGEGHELVEEILLLAQQLESTP